MRYSCKYIIQWVWEGENCERRLYKEYHTEAEWWGWVCAGGGMLAALFVGAVEPGQDRDSVGGWFWGYCGVAGWWGGDCAECGAVDFEFGGTPEGEVAGREVCGEDREFEDGWENIYWCGFGCY